MQYGRDIDVDLPDDGTEQFVAIPLGESDEAVRADVTVSSGSLNTGSADYNLYVWSDKGELFEVTDSDSSNFTQLGSTFSVSDTNAHDIGAQFRAGDYGFAILGLVSAGDASNLTVTGDFVSNLHDSANDHPLNHATAGNLNEDVYTDGTAQ